MVVVLHPSYSPDLGPCDSFFPKMKLKLKGKIFHSILEISKILQQMVTGIMKKVFRICFQTWQSSWVQCINSKGEDFEGVKMQNVVT
jgi:transposase